MKIWILLSVCIALACAQLPNLAPNAVANFLNTNPALVQKEIDCLMDRASCDDIGNFLKRSVPEVMNRNCAKCNPQQALLANAILGYMRQNRPKDLAEIQEHYANA
uniref:Chemosensory protein n=1 Tax=Blattella germanica TaxID=6973 RepID=A0A109ZX72_BLAGE|nr:chemosensory protein [Blattella germanica]